MLTLRDPFDYDVVGPMISDFVERGLSPRDLVDQFQSKQLSPTRYSSQGGSVYDKYDEESFGQLSRQLYRSLNVSVYKRLQGAPIIAVSARAFGFDLRETIINGWGDR